MMRPGGSQSRSARGQVTNLPAVPGVIETIAIGLSLALVYPLLALLPFLADALVWSGARPRPTAFAADSSAHDLLESTGLIDGLVPLIGFFVPSLLAWIDRDRLYTAGDGLIWSLESGWTIALVLASLLLLGALVHAGFKVPLSFVLRHQAVRPLPLFRSVAVAWLRYLGLGALAVGITVLVTLPLAVAGGLLYLVGVNATPLFLVLLGIPLILAGIIFSFALDAIAYSEVGPFRACYLSYNVVRRNLRPVLGLVFSVTLISGGLPALWLSQADHPIGLLIGVFCNAVIATGLAAASMQFYADRLGRWQRLGATAAGPGRLSASAPS